MEPVSTTSRRRKQRKRHLPIHMQCGICRHVVSVEKRGSTPTMVRHEVDHGDVVDSDTPACIGMQFPNLAVPVM